MMSVFPALFCTRYPLLHRTSLDLYVENLMTWDPDDFERVCAYIFEFLATMRRPIRPKMMADIREVEALLRCFDDSYPRRAQLSPNQRIFTIYDMNLTRDESDIAVERYLIVNVKSLHQLEVISKIFNKDCGYPTVDGIRRFKANTEISASHRRRYFLERSGHVAQLFTTNSVFDDNIERRYGIVVIAPRVSR